MFNDSINNNDRKLYSTNGKVIGWIEGKSICKRVRESRHMLRVPRGWAWDAAVLERARREGLDRTLIIDTEQGKVYEASVDDFDRYGVKFNRGHGDQICLPLKYWDIQRQKSQPVFQMELPL